MARPLRIQFPGAFYHITYRGIERRQIFLDDKERHRFLAYVSESLGTYQADPIILLRKWKTDPNNACAELAEVNLTEVA